MKRNRAESYSGSIVQTNATEMANSTTNGIFIDGANVAREFDPSKTFSVTGLLRCAVYFRQRQFATKIILNRNWRAVAASGRLEDGDQLIKLEAANGGIVAYTPIGVCEKEYLIKEAFDQGGIIVSNENFEREKEKRHDWAHFINRRRLPFRFISNEFVPMTPKIDGRTVNVDEFLRSRYEVESNLSSAASLANYLLTLGIDESVGPANTDDRSDRRRVREVRAVETAPSGPPKRRYLVGTIADVSMDTGSIEFCSKGDKKVWTYFGLDACRRVGRPVCDLRREFRAGEWVAFVSVKHQQRAGWDVIEVRKKGDTSRGYGRYKPLGNEATSGLIEPRYKNESGGGNVYFPGAAFRETGVQMKQLSKEDWLYFYAMNEKPSAGCTAVAVEVCWATTAGVIVKKTQSSVYVWSKKIGLARGELVSFPEGTWVKFRFKQRAERGNEEWIISDLEMMASPAGVTINADEAQEPGEVLINVRCPAVVGVLTDTYGTVWTEAFGLLYLSTGCVKRIPSTEASNMRPYQPIRVWASYNGVTDVEMDRNGEGMAAASSSRYKAKSKKEHWNVISCIVTTMDTASSLQIPFPPPSIIFEVEAAVMMWENENSERGPHWILMSERYGTIFATPFDVAGDQKALRVGERVKVSIVPQGLSYGDEYRAFVIEAL